MDGEEVNPIQRANASTTAHDAHDRTTALNPPARPAARPRRRPSRVVEDVPPRIGGQDPRESRVPAKLCCRCNKVLQGPACASRSRGTEANEVLPESGSRLRTRVAALIRNAWRSRRTARRCADSPGNTAPPRAGPHSQARGHGEAWSDVRLADIMLIDPTVDSPTRIQS